jgi:hypothetical protein
MPTETMTPPNFTATRARFAHERAMRAEIRQRRYTERHPDSTLCLGIPPRVFGSLRRAGVHTIDQLGQMEGEGIRALGVSTVEVSNIIVALDRHYS